MKSSFKRAILYARAHRANEGVNESLHRVSQFLQQRNVDTFLDIDTASFFQELKIPVLARDEMGTKEDVIIVVGGDGSLLSAARMAIKVNVPVVGINRGRLGFLTDINPQEIEQQLGHLLEGNYEEEHRFLLHTRIASDEQTYFQGDALNDVVLMPGDEPQMIEFSVFIDKNFVCHHRADGFIIATPTGSTAYALSAGGPILHPTLDAMVLVPMFSHSLNSRPIVIDSQRQITLKITDSNEHCPRVSCDGHERKLVKPGQTITIKKNAQQLRLLHPLDYQYYDTLRAKLGWENKG